MFDINSTSSADVEPAIATLGDAFADDPLMLYLFKDNPDGVRAGAMRFFTLLLKARIALDMPADILRQDGAIRGAAMGYDTSRPTWPAPLTAEWNAFEASVPGFTERLAVYEHNCEAHQPTEDHYYLGVIGVDPALQGRGAGKALLDVFCARSDADAKSGGVYLDTTNPNSLQFYYKNGFELRGEGNIDGAPLWCVYRKTPRP